MTSWLRSILHPEAYHGRHMRPPFFEGWYFKLVDPTERHRYAVIPGIFSGQSPQESHAFVQLLDGTTGQATYHPYPVSSFAAADAEFDIRVGPNRFQLDCVQLDIASPERAVSGQVRFSGLVPWPVTLWSPGIMGPFAWIPMMECYHGVLGFDHQIEGAWQVDGARVDWTGGRGYIEKDWGRSFPRAWVWMQTNHFAGPGTSLSLSVAIIPWLGTSFRGFIAGLWHQGVLYRFATYTGARIESLHIGEQRVDLALRGGRRRLEVHAFRSEAGVLRGPSGADMGVRVPESMLGRIHVRLSQHQQGRDRLLFEGEGRSAGIEVVGEIDRLQL